MIEFFKSVFSGMREVKETGGVSGFLLRTPHKEKMEVLKEVARKANEEQRETFSRSSSQLKARQ